MQCLYCGKGVGPIRQIRGASFCCEEHRNQYRDVYRREAYAALAPGPAPKLLADFLERTTPAAGPAPHPLLNLLLRHFAHRPRIRAEAAPVSLERFGLIFNDAPAKMPVCPAWQDTPAAYAPLVSRVALSAEIRSDALPAAGASLTALDAVSFAARPTALERGKQTNAPAPYIATMPAAARPAKPVKADAQPPELHAFAPGSDELAAIGPVANAVRTAPVAPSGVSIARTPAFDRMEPARQTVPAPAMLASEPRPLQTGPLSPSLQNSAADAIPLAFDPFENRRVAVTIPKPPAAAAASSTWTDTLRRAQTAKPVQVEQPLSQTARIVNLPEVPAEATARQGLQMAPAAGLAAPQAAGLPSVSPAWQAARTYNRAKAQARSSGSGSAVYSAAPMGALAGSIAVAGPRGAAGNQAPSAAASEPIRTDLHAVPQVTAELAGASVSTELCAPTEPSSAVAAAAPIWNPDLAHATAQPEPLVPRADLNLAPIEWRPEPAGRIAASAPALRPHMGRAVRSCAVLWTLRVVRLANPSFLIEAVRLRLTDLLHAGQSMQYSLDLEDVRRAKKKVRAIKREPVGSPRLKWQYIGIAAALVLAAVGTLRILTPSRSSAASLPEHGMGIRQWISRRATRDFTDDFRAGLSQWKGVQAKWPKSWAYNTDGFIRPGQLALYRPSVPLSDYRFEFMAQVENKSVDWVVRAQDADNYYALKFAVVQPGPRPIVSMVRYAVIDGERGDRVETPLRLMIHANTPYRVSVDVKGNRYRALIEDQEADLWTDDRLKTGGVGFFSEAGERARVYWVKLESHGDILGRICGLLSGDGESGATNKEAMKLVPDLFRHAFFMPALQIRRNQTWITGIAEPRT